MTFNYTPEFTSTDFERLTSSQPPRLKMTTELMKHWLFEKAEDSDS